MDTATEDLSAYLSSKGLAVNRANGAEVTVHCPFCPDGDPRGKGKLYLNTETWLYDCKRCGTRGNRITLLKHYGDQDDRALTYLPGQDPMKVRKVLEAAVEVAHEMLVNNDDMLAYFFARGLTARTIERYKLGYVPLGWKLSSNLSKDNLSKDNLSKDNLSKDGASEHARADVVAAGLIQELQGGATREFFAGKIVIPYPQRGSYVQLRAKDPKAKYFTPSGHPVRLFNSDALAGAEDVIITEGEFDCLILQQTLELSSDPRARATAVVGLPGAESFPTGMEHMFSEAKRVYIALDPDDPGKRGAIKLKEMLGSKARIVNLPDDLPKCDWTEYLTTRKHNLSDVMELLSTASGRRLWTVADAGAKWRRRQVDGSGIKTGFAELDAWIAPGLEPGELCVPLAKTGTGKTNFIANVAYYSRETPQMILTLEMMASQVYERLRRIYLFWNPLATDAEVDHAYRRVMIVDENRLKEGDIAALAAEYEAEQGFRPQLCHLDYLGYYAKGCKGTGQYEKVTNAVMAVKAEAKSSDLAILCPAQVNRSAQDGRPIDADDARDSGAIEETADFLLSLYRPTDALLDGTVNQRDMPSAVVNCGVLKNRKGAKGRQTSLVFSSASLVMLDPRQFPGAAKLVEEENRMLWRGESYNSVRSMRIANAGRTHQLTLVPATA
jgi:hypothetical protein